MTKEQMQEIFTKVGIETSEELEMVILDGVNRFLDNPDHAEKFYKAPNDLLKAFYVLSYATSAYPKLKALKGVKKGVEGKFGTDEWRYLERNTENVTAKIEYGRRGKICNKQIKKYNSQIVHNFNLNR